jgi:hypothetical protein
MAAEGWALEGECPASSASPLSGSTCFALPLPNCRYQRPVRIGTTMEVTMTQIATSGVAVFTNPLNCGATAAMASEHLLDTTE